MTQSQFFVFLLPPKTSNYIMSHRLIRKASGFSHRRRQSTKRSPKGFGRGIQTGVSTETMKTTTVTTRLIANATAGSSQRGSREYQRKPSAYLVASHQVSFAVPKGPSFREILEREMGPSTGSRAGSVGAGQTAKAASQAEAETTQILSGYWA